jgi:hypothetical protein
MRPQTYPHQYGNMASFDTLVFNDMLWRLNEFGVAAPVSAESTRAFVRLWRGYKDSVVHLQLEYSHFRQDVQYPHGPDRRLPDVTVAIPYCSACNLRVMVQDDVDSAANSVTRLKFEWDNLDDMQSCAGAGASSVRTISSACTFAGPRAIVVGRLLPCLRESGCCLVVRSELDIEDDWPAIAAVTGAAKRAAAITFGADVPATTSSLAVTTSVVQSMGRTACNVVSSDAMGALLTGYGSIERATEIVHAAKENAPGILGAVLVSVEHALVAIQDAPYVGSVVKILLLVRRGLAQVHGYQKFVVAFSAEVDLYADSCVNIKKLYPSESRPPGVALQRWLASLENTLADAVGKLPTEQVDSKTWLQGWYNTIRDTVLLKPKLESIRNALKEKWLQLGPAIAIEILDVSKGGISGHDDELLHRIVSELQNIVAQLETAKGRLNNSALNGSMHDATACDKAMFTPGELDAKLKARNLILGSLPHISDEPDRAATVDLPPIPVPLTLRRLLVKTMMLTDVPAKQRMLSDLGNGCALGTSVEPGDSPHQEAYNNQLHWSETLGTSKKGLDQLIDTASRLQIVAGDAGTGKTCLLQTIAYCHAAKVTQSDARGGIYHGMFVRFRRVIFLRLGACAAVLTTPGVVDACITIGALAAQVVASAYGFMDTTTGFYDLDSLQTSLFNPENARRTLWLLDAFDELPGAADIVNQLRKAPFGVPISATDALRAPSGAFTSLTGALPSVLKLFASQPHVIISTRPQFANDLACVDKLLSTYVHLEKLPNAEVRKFVVQSLLDKDVMEIASAALGGRGDTADIMIAALTHDPAMVSKRFKLPATVVDAAVLGIVNSPTKLGRLLSRMLAQPDLREAMRTPFVMHMAITAGELVECASKSGASAGSAAASCTRIDAVAYLYGCMEEYIQCRIKQRLPEDPVELTIGWDAKWGWIKTRLCDAALAGCAASQVKLEWPDDPDRQCELEIILRGSVINKLVDGRVEFVHRSLQEYFAAQGIVDIVKEAIDTNTSTESADFDGSKQRLDAQLNMAICADANDMLRRFVMAYAPNADVVNDIAKRILTAPSAAASAALTLGSSTLAIQAPSASHPTNSNEMSRRWRMLAQCLPFSGRAPELYCKDMFEESASEAWGALNAGLEHELFRDAGFWVVADAVMCETHVARATRVLNAFMDSLAPWASTLKPLQAVKVLRYIDTRDEDALRALKRVQDSHRDSVQLAAIVASGVLEGPNGAARDSLFKLLVDKTRGLLYEGMQQMSWGCNTCRTLRLLTTYNKCLPGLN